MNRTYTAIRRMTDNRNEDHKDMLRSLSDENVRFILVGASGLQFEPAYRNSIPVNIEGIEFRIRCINDLILNKEATGRTKYLADAEALESLKNSEHRR